MHGASICVLNSETTVRPIRQADVNKRNQMQSKRCRHPFIRCGTHPDRRVRDANALRIESSTQVHGVMGVRTALGLKAHASMPLRVACSFERHGTMTLRTEIGLECIQLNTLRADSGSHAHDVISS
jgi:hypothetical protein